MAGYHNNFILKHANSSVHKLKEEVEEFIDAVAAGNTIMAQQELSDVYLKLHHLIRDYGLSMDDLKVMADTTERVFESGCRKESNLFDVISSNVGYIIHNNITGHIHMLCHDVNYRYVFHNYDDTVNFELPQNTEYVEVIHGEIYSPDHKRQITEGSIIQDCGKRISIHENAIILIKTIGFDLDSLKLFSPVAYDKSDIHFTLLKRAITDDF